MILRALGWRFRSTAEGPGVAIFAGLIPCPLTLFAMIFAIGHGVPEAGLAFAISMVMGVATTLGVVAFVAVFARKWLVAIFDSKQRHLTRLSRVVEGLAGTFLFLIGLREVLFR